MTLDRRISGITDRRNFKAKAFGVETHFLEATESNGSPNSSVERVPLDLNQRLVEANEKLVVASIESQTIAENLEKASVKMTHLATHDFLTDLPNRMQLYDRIGQAILLAKRDRTKLAILFLDLDKFKAINDSYGHSIGDLLLKSVAERLQDTIRRSDTASRQGGDEFILLLSAVNDEDSLRLMIEKIQRILSSPYLIAENTMYIGCAIGVSVFPDHGDDTETLIRCADLAMYRAKQRGPNQYEIFSSTMQNDVAPAARIGSGNAQIIKDLATKCSPWFIAIGASGSEGLSDIKAVLGELPASLDAVILVVFHRPWDQPSHLQADLSRVSNMRVMTATEGERLESGTVYIGEPAEHLTLVAKSFGTLIDDPNRYYANRTIDLLFESVAAYGGTQMIGVVLSGSLDDGSRGLAAIHHVGGLSMVLTPDFSIFPGMPENAIAYDGAINTIGNAHQIALAIIDAIQPENVKHVRDIL